MAQKAEYNTILTERAFTPDDDFCRARKAHVLCDASGKILGSVSNTGVYDLFGNEIASVTGETQTKVGNEDVRVIRYAAGTHTYCLEGDALYGTSGEKKYIGSIVKKERNPFKIIVLSALAVLLIVTIILLALIQMPSVNVPPDPDDDIVPVIDIRDNNGAWEAQGVVAVFGDTICPGDTGEYGFILGNPHDAAMTYTFYIEPIYNGSVVAEFPIEFRLRMNNLPVQSVEWKSVEELRFEELHILPQSSQSFTLEWRWPFSAGKDENDTLIGKDGGKISMVLHVSAKVR